MKRTTATPAINVVPDNPDEPTPVEILESSIVSIAASMKRVDQSRLTEDAIVTLLHRACPSGSVSRSQIETVLRNLRSLEKRWLKPKPAK